MPSKTDMQPYGCILPSPPRGPSRKLLCFQQLTAASVCKLFHLLELDCK